MRATITKALTIVTLGISLSTTAADLPAVTAGFVEMAGGVPLTVNGELVGAIGVSSAQADWDVQIAAAGAAALVAKP